MKNLFRKLKHYFFNLYYKLFKIKKKKTENLIKITESKQNLFKPKWVFKYKNKKRCVVCHNPFFGHRNRIGYVCSKECYNKLKTVL